jgi:hypothetical protein
MKHGIRIRENVFPAAIFTPIGLLLLLQYSARGEQPIEIRSSAEIHAASSMVSSLRKLGLLPGTFDVDEATAQLILSATGSATQPSANGQLVLTAVRPEMAGFRAQIAYATAAFHARSPHGETAIDLSPLKVLLPRTFAKSFGYDISIINVTIDGSMRYIVTESEHRAVFENTRESADALVIEATPGRLELRGIDLFLAHLESNPESTDPVRSLKGSGTLAPVSWKFVHPAFGEILGTLEANLHIENGLLQVRDIRVATVGPLPLSALAAIDLDLSQLTGTFEIHSSLEDALTISLGGDFDMAQGKRGTVAGTFELEDIEALWPSVGSYFGAEASQWLVGGSLSGVFDATTDESSLRATLELQGQRLQGLSPDVTLGWGAADFVMTATHELTGATLDTELSIALHPGEVLLGGNFLNFEDRALHLRAMASTSIDERRVHLRHGEIDVANGAATLRIRGGANQIGDRIAGWMHTDTGTTDLARLYRELAPVLLQEATPDYSLSGSARIEETVQLDTDLVLEGTAEIASATLALADPPVSISDLDLSLPYRIRIPSGNDTTDLGNKSQEPSRLGVLARIPTSGSASIGFASVVGIPIPGLQFRPVLWDNHLGLAGGLDFDLLGGTGTLSQLDIDDVMAPLSRILISGSIRKIDLGSLCEALDLPSLRGSATLEVPQASLEGKDLVLAGETRLDVFEGTIHIRDLRIEDFLGLSPILAFSADFEALNLGEITRVIPIGRMEGAVKGYAHDFRLSLDPLEPYAFDIQIETDEGPRLPQTISIEAVRTVVEVGDAGDFRLPWLFQFFDRYTYKSLGLHASLQNDVLKMEGLIRRGETSYFMLGSGAARINFIAPSTERGHSYGKIVRALKSRIRQIRKAGLSGVTIE